MWGNPQHKHPSRVYGNTLKALRRVRGGEVRGEAHPPLISPGESIVSSSALARSQIHRFGAPTSFNWWAKNGRTHAKGPPVTITPLLCVYIHQRPQQQRKCQPATLPPQPAAPGTLSLNSSYKEQGTCRVHMSSLHRSHKDVSLLSDQTPRGRSAVSLSSSAPAICSDLFTVLYTKSVKPHQRTPPNAGTTMPHHLHCVYTQSAYDWTCTISLYCLADNGQYPALANPDCSRFPGFNLTQTDTATNELPFIIL